MKLSPPTHSGLKILDKELFNIRKTVHALVIHARDSKNAMNSLRDNGILNIKSMPSIVKAPEHVKDYKEKRLVLLSPEITESELNDDKFTKLTSETTTHTITIDYNYWSTDQILRSIIPSDMEVPSSFSTIGHIAHFNLRPEYNEFKHIIGQIVLDKNKHIRTVVNKLDTIDHTFRFFEMELLAGVEDYIATQRESGCLFKFDFSKVYWNSRLQTEHRRLCNLFKRGEIVCDVFGGVGPFAIPASKEGAYVWANDLNPMSYEYLIENIALNHVKDKVVACNLDGREFIKKSLELINDQEIWNKFANERNILNQTRNRVKKEPIPEDPVIKEKVKFPNHYVMNLPATAIDFLDAFYGLFQHKSKDTEMPMIHVYCFSKNDYEKDTIERIQKILGPIDNPIVVDVRNVGPKTEMMCCSFKLPKSVAFSTKRKH